MHRVLFLTFSGRVISSLFFFFLCFVWLFFFLNNERSSTPLLQVLHKAIRGSNPFGQRGTLNFNIYLPFRYKYITKWTVTLTAFGKIRKSELGIFFSCSRSEDVTSPRQFATLINTFSNCRDTSWGTGKQLIDWSWCKNLLPRHNVLKSRGPRYQMCKMRNARLDFFLKMNPMNRNWHGKKGAQAKTSSSIVQQRSHWQIGSLPNTLEEIIKYA